MLANDRWVLALMVGLVWGGVTGCNLPDDGPDETVGDTWSLETGPDGQTPDTTADTGGDTADTAHTDDTGDTRASDTSTDTGEATNACPNAVIETARTPQQPGSHRRWLSFGATVELSGAPSSDPDGQIERYAWTLTEKPPRSSARLAPSSNHPDPTLETDVLGTYRLELVVYDEQGEASCQPAELTIHVAARHEIHVQLLWETPGDTDPTDETGANLDLYYHNVTHGSSWSAGAPWTVYWQNKQADWGMQNVQTDDPSLDFDDRDGRGPEHISHRNPPSGESFAVGVHYRDANDLGPSEATVRVFLEGKLTQSYTRTLQKTDQFWEVVEINWPQKTLVKRDKLHDAIP